MAHGQLHSDENEDARDAVLQEAEVAQQAREHEVQRPQAEHGERGGREVDEDAVVLRELRGHGVHGEEDVDDLQHNNHEQQEGAAPSAAPARAAACRGATLRRAGGACPVLHLRIAGVGLRVGLSLGRARLGRSHRRRGPDKLAAARRRLRRRTVAGLLPRAPGEQRAAGVVGVRDGKAPRDEPHAEVLPGVLVLVVSGHSGLVAAPHEHRPEEQLHHPGQVEERGAHPIEAEAQQHSAQNPQEERLVHLVSWRGVGHEDHVEEEDVVHGQQVLQDVPVEPCERARTPERHPDPGVEGETDDEPEHAVQVRLGLAPLIAASAPARREEAEVEGRQAKEDHREGGP
mmetsp:Transcript_60398/g.167149  ORF Transcript_60398/g.167149 Transcript_60398/m.167149 type:complete len:345 (+) Transcript_60398:637-1671(+)